MFATFGLPMWAAMVEGNLVYNLFPFHNQEPAMIKTIPVTNPNQGIRLIAVLIPATIIRPNMPNKKTKDSVTIVPMTKALRNSFTIWISCDWFVAEFM